jgi:hypothetical protein
VLLREGAGQRCACAALLALSPLGLAMAGIFTLASSLLLHNLAALLLFAIPVLGLLRIQATIAPANRKSQP